MTTELRTDLSSTDLLAVAGLAAGYQTSRDTTGIELDVLSGAIDPVALTVRLTHRVLMVGALDGRTPHDIAALAGHFLRSTSYLAGTKEHAQAILTLGEGHCPAPANAPAYLDAAAVAGWLWTDLVDGACAALRFTLVSVSEHPLRSPITAQLLARAASLTFAPGTLPPPPAPAR